MIQIRIHSKTSSTKTSVSSVAEPNCSTQCDSPTFNVTADLTAAIDHSVDITEHLPSTDYPAADDITAQEKTTCTDNIQGAGQCDTTSTPNTQLVDGRVGLSASRWMATSKVPTVGCPLESDLVAPSSSPHQPQTCNFPQRVFGTKKYRFQASWFQRWPWLHYIENSDAVLCHVCTKANNLELPLTEKGDPAFTTTGYTGWKKATESGKGFAKHENSTFHKNALSLLTEAEKSKDIAEQLCSQYEAEKITRRNNLIKILSSVRFLARQGLPLRGHGADTNSNLNQLLILRGEDDVQLRKWIERKGERKYTSHEIQNEMLKVMALYILRDVATSIRNSSFYSILADETTDISNREQVVICLRWVDDDLDVHEDFIGLHKVDRIDAATIKTVILDVLMRMDLSLHKCRGQCYDGCSTMAGSKGGVATLLKEIEPRALYTHCYGHALNLACVDTIKQCRVLKDALDTTQEITKLVKLSPKRDARFQTIRDQNPIESSSGVSQKNIRLLCPTRWTVRADAMKSILNYYKELQELWDWCSDEYTDTESKARVQGVASQMTKFEYFFGLSLCERILKHADSLSENLQMRDLSSCEAQEIAKMMVKTLSSIRNDQSFDLFWQKVVADSKSKGVGEAQMPRRRRAPRRIEECFGGTAEAEYPTDVAAYYRSVFYEALDLVISCVNSRFDQDDYRTYSSCERLLLKAVSGNEDLSDEVAKVAKFYGSDFSADQLRTHLEVLRANYNGELNVHRIFRYLKDISPAKRALMAEAVKLAKLLMVIPATNASSERAFSTLRYIKNYLRSTMHQERLNNLMLTYVYRDQLDKMDLTSIANDFVNGRDGRMGFFGKF